MACVWYLLLRPKLLHDEGLRVYKTAREGPRGHTSTYSFAFSLALVERKVSGTMHDA